jgi:hypothetical protein
MPARPADIPSDISLDLWQKFVIIVTMSSITSAMRSTIGPIRANPHARSFALDLMREVVAVGRAQGIALEADFADKRVSVIDALSPDMRASMSLDLELGRPLECSPELSSISAPRRVSRPPAAARCATFWRSTWTESQLEGLELPMVRKKQQAPLAFKNASKLGDWLEKHHGADLQIRHGRAVGDVERLRY